MEQTGMLVGNFEFYQRKAVIDALSPVATILLFKTPQKYFFCYHLQCSFKIFITLFNFLHVKANPKEIGEEMLFPYFFPKNADASIFVEIQG